MINKSQNYALISEYQGKIKIHHIIESTDKKGARDLLYSRVISYAKELTRSENVLLSTSNTEWVDIAEYNQFIESLQNKTAGTCALCSSGNNIEIWYVTVQPISIYMGLSTGIQKVCNKVGFFTIAAYDTTYGSLANARSLQEKLLAKQIEIDDLRKKLLQTEEQYVKCRRLLVNKSNELRRVLDITTGVSTPQSSDETLIIDYCDEIIDKNMNEDTVKNATKGIIKNTTKSTVKTTKFVKKTDESSFGGRRFHATVETDRPRQSSVATVQIATMSPDCFQSLVNFDRSKLKSREERDRLLMLNNLKKRLNTSNSPETTM